MKIKVYLSNLAKYVEGRENGRWLQLPMEPEQLKKVLQEILEDGQEGIILDSEAPFEIREFSNLMELNDKLIRLQECEEDQLLLEVLFSVRDELDVVLKAVEDGTYTVIDVEESSKGWCSALWGPELYGLVLDAEGYNTLFDEPIPEDVKDYVDFEKIYNCLSVNDGWQTVTVDDKTYLVTMK